MYQLYKSLSESVQSISDSPVELLTLCSCPPETSSCAVKCDLDEVGGSIFNISHLEKLAFSYGSNAYPVNGTSVPSNLE